MIFVFIGTAVLAAFCVAGAIWCGFGIADDEIHPASGVLYIIVLLAGAAFLGIIGTGSLDDDERPSNASGNESPETDTAEYADVQIYFQEATYNGVHYTCLLAGYSNYPGMWCERTPESELDH